MDNSKNSTKANDSSAGRDWADRFTPILILNWPSDGLAEFLEGTPPPGNVLAIRLAGDDLEE
jgi:hypothetical protein